MNYTLPESIEVCGSDYRIRSDYRAVLDICAALSDPDLNENEKAIVCLYIFYPDFDEIPVSEYNEAIKKCFWFIAGGKEEKNNNKQPKIVDWEKDFPLIAGPVNKVLGREIRSLEPLHWWSFLSAYMEIGDCLFAQVIRIRSKKAQGKPLTKDDREFYRKNRDLVDIKQKYSEAENDLIKMWT